MKKKNNVRKFVPLTKKQCDEIDRAHDEAMKFVGKTLKAIKALPHPVKAIAVQELKNVFDKVEITIKWK